MLYECFYAAYLAVTYEGERADQAREDLAAILPDAVELAHNATAAKSTYQLWMLTRLQLTPVPEGTDTAAILLAGVDADRSPRALWSGIKICVCGSIADGFKSGPGELYNLWVEAAVNPVDVQRDDPAFYAWLDAVRADWEYPRLRPLILDGLPAEASSFLSLELRRTGSR